MEANPVVPSSILSVRLSKLLSVHLSYTRYECSSHSIPGSILNTPGKTHGSPEDENRMVGDLGNIVADESGNCEVDIKGNKLVQLLGPHSVLGRSIVIYAGEDDQGRGGHENSGTTGNAGPRIAAGVIGLSL